MMKPIGKSKRTPREIGVGTYKKKWKDIDPTDLQVGHAFALTVVDRRISDETHTGRI